MSSVVHDHVQAKGVELPLAQPPGRFRRLPTTVTPRMLAGVGGALGEHTDGPVHTRLDTVGRACAVATSPLRVGRRMKAFADLR